MPLQASAGLAPGLGLGTVDADGAGDVPGELLAEADASGDAAGPGLHGSGDRAADVSGLSADAVEPGAVGYAGGDVGGGVGPNAGPQAATTQIAAASSRAAVMNERATSRA